MWLSAPANMVPTPVDRVGGVGDQGDVAWVQEAESRVADTLFGADERQHLGVRVQLDVKAGVGHAAFCFLDPGDIALI